MYIYIYIYLYIYKYIYICIYTCPTPSHRQSVAYASALARECVCIHACLCLHALLINSGRLRIHATLHEGCPQAWEFQHARVLSPALTFFFSVRRIFLSFVMRTCFLSRTFSLSSSCSRAHSHVFVCMLSDSLSVLAYTQNLLLPCTYSLFRSLSRLVRARSLSHTLTHR